jgi:magnesium transporter
MKDQIPDFQIVVAELQSDIETGKHDLALQKFTELSLGDQGYLFSLLDQPSRDFLLDSMNIDATADLFDRLDDAITLEAAENLSTAQLAGVLEEMQPDEAADLLGDLPTELAEQALGEMQETEDILPLLAYPDETAGGRMTTEFIAMHGETKTSQAIQHLRKVSPDHEVPYYIFVTDNSKRLTGVLGLRELVVAKANSRINQIMDKEVIRVDANLDQEEVANVMTRHELSAIPVVDQQGIMLGVITHDDILDVISEEATEDIYLLASVSGMELEPDSPIPQQIRGRLPWLYLNALTALFAAWVVSNFEELIARVATLAIFLSVVGGLGGNASSQTVALMVRALALGKTSPRKVGSVLARELLVGAIQGLAVGLIVALGVSQWQGNPYMGLVVGVAIFINLILAGFVGALIPLGLKAFGQDPALASTVLVTTITDSVGFLVLLSLAAYYLPRLI